MISSKSVLAFTACVICASSASAEAFLTIDAPAPNALVADSVNISCTVLGAARAEATLGSLTIDLANNGSGNLALEGEPAGTKVLTVTAYDANNVPTVKTVPLTLDRPPRITVDSPAYGQVVMPGILTVSAHCTDDGPTPCTITSPSTFVIGEPGDQTQPKVVVTAVDSAGQMTSAGVNIIRESNPRLREVLQAASGTVLDFDGSRALVLSEDKLQATVWTSSSGPLVAYSGTLPVIGGQLLPQGALVKTENRSGASRTTTTWKWDGSTTVEVGADARAAGNWLAIVQNIPVPSPMDFPADYIFAQKVVLRDLTTGADAFETPFRPGVRVKEFDVAKNGDLLWQEDASPGQVYERRSSTVSRWMLAGRPLGGLQLDEQYATGSYSSFNTNYAYLFSASGEVELCSTTSLGSSCAGPVLNNGWVGFGKLNRSGMPLPPNRLFRRSPSGAIDELTGFDAKGIIEAISPTGEVSVLAERRSIGGGGAAPVEVSSSGGKVIYLDRWYILLGRSVFEVGEDSTNHGGDAGVPDDAGASKDAGVPDDAGATVGLPIADASIDGGGTGSPKSDASAQPTSMVDAAVDPTSTAEDSDGCSLRASSSTAGTWNQFAAVASALAMSWNGRRRKKS